MESLSSLPAAARQEEEINGQGLRTAEHHYGYSCVPEQTRRQSLDACPVPLSEHLQGPSPLVADTDTCTG